MCLIKFFFQMVILGWACIEPITFGLGIFYIKDMFLTKFVQMMILGWDCMSQLHLVLVYVTLGICEYKFFSNDDPRLGLY